MECPRCQAELEELPADDLKLHRCDPCSSLWIDVAELNRMLIHNNFSGLETLGGKLDTEALTDQCSECTVDLVRVNGGSRQEPQHYDTCESCGGVFLEGSFEDINDVADAEAQIVAFFRTFGAKKQSALGA